MEQRESDAARSDLRAKELREALLRAVRAVCPWQLAADREDLVQSAVIKVLNQLRSNEGKSVFTASYLRRVAYSAVIDELRRRGRRKEVAFDGSPTECEPVTQPDDPDRSTRSRELGREIESCLEKLVPPRRLAVTMHLLGHSLKESAARLGWPQKRVENLVYRGLHDLRACLRSKGLEP